MGLPEVADFARNFAVMVRVIGPDPKGLKMRNHAFHHYNSGKTTLSASGMIFPTSSECNLKSPETVIILTVASVIEPFILKQYRENKVEDEPRLISDVQIDILMEGKSVIDGSMEGLPWIPAEIEKIVNIPQSSAAVQSLIEASCGSMENSWEVGWSLATHSRGPQHIVDNFRAQVEESPFPNHWSMARTESSNPNLMAQSATRIALLKIPSKFFTNFTKLRTYIPKRGDLLLAMGSPFGILSPLHFFNNISVGSIGNSYPPGSSTKSLLMADIRCLPGMEGSPVFSEHARFIGLMTRPLRQKNSGTEVQMVIPWEAIASACSDLPHADPRMTWKGINCNNNNNNGDSTSVDNTLPNVYPDELPNHLHDQIHSESGLISPVEKAMASVCLITTDDGSWASGVLINKQGLVLTNAHLLEPWRFGKTAANGDRVDTKPEVAIIPNIRTTLDTFSGEIENSSRNLYRNVRVRLDCMDPWMWTGARIIYVCKGPLDIAILQLDIVPDRLCPVTVDLGCPSCGSKAYVIGHGLFGPRCDILPSACLGVVAKVIEATRSNTQNSQHFPAMLETTSAVHPGSSGGAVVNSYGRMIGLVTSNAKHGGGTVIPHLNFSIPCAALHPVFKFAEDMQDVKILEELDKPNEHLSYVWALMPPLYPKREPYTQKLPIEDNSKSTKGSRFAKFIADSTKGQDGMAESFTNDLIPSKL